MNHKLKYKHKIRKSNTDLWDPGLGKEFLNLRPKAQSIKGKNNKGNFIKQKKLLCEKSGEEDIQKSYK